MTERITSPQLKQLNRLVEDAVEFLGLSKEAAQRVLAQGGIFKERVTAVLQELAADKASSEIHADQLIPSGWEIVKGSDVASTLKAVADLELVEFLQPGEEYVVGNVMRERAVKSKAVLGLSDAAFLLKHSAEIPEAMRQYCIVFTGTVLRDPGGNRRVAYLYWVGERWCLNFCWLGDNFDRHCRLSRCKSVGT